MMSYKRHRPHHVIVKKIIKKVRIAKHSRPCGKSRYVVKHKIIKIKKIVRRKPRMNDRPREPRLENTRPRREGRNRNRVTA